MSRTAIALAIGLALTAVAVVVTLSRSPLVLAKANVPSAEYQVLAGGKPTMVCQSGETLPRGATAMRFSMSALTLGPRIEVHATSSAGVLTSGVKQAGWRGGSVTVPVHSVAHTTADVKVCIATGSNGESFGISGEQSAASVAASNFGKRLGGRIKIEYLRPGSRSWWSLLTTVARRIGLGNAAGGGWIALVLVACMALATALASWLLLRPARERR